MLDSLPPEGSPLQVERGSSVVEWRTLNRGSPGSNPLCYRFEAWIFSFSPCRPSSLSCINEYMTIGSGGNMGMNSLGSKLLLECSILPGGGVTCKSLWVIQRCGYRATVYKKVLSSVSLSLIKNIYIINVTSFFNVTSRDGKTTWTNTGATRYGRGWHKITLRRHAEAFAIPRDTTSAQ